MRGCQAAGGDRLPLAAIDKRRRTVAIGPNDIKIMSWVIESDREPILSAPNVVTTKNRPIKIKSRSLPAAVQIKQIMPNRRAAVAGIPKYMTKEIQESSTPL